MTKTYKPLNDEDISENMSDIVAFLGAIESSRLEINERVKHLKNEYGLVPADIRAAARLMYKENAEELGEKEQRIRDILEICR